MNKKVELTAAYIKGEPYLKVQDVILVLLAADEKTAATIFETAQTIHPEPERKRGFFRR